MKRTIKLFLTITIAAATGFVFTASANAACRGLASSACKANDNCVWVGGYETKKGNKVKSYCRAKPTKGVKKRIKDRDKPPKRAEMRDRIKDKKKKMRDRVEGKDRKKKKVKKDRRDRKDRKDKKKKKRKKYDRKKR